MNVKSGIVTSTGDPAKRSSRTSGARKRRTRISGLWWVSHASSVQPPMTAKTGVPMMTRMKIRRPNICLRPRLGGGLRRWELVGLVGIDARVSADREQGPHDEPDRDDQETDREDEIRSVDQLASGLTSARNDDEGRPRLVVRDLQPIGRLLPIALRQPGRIEPLVPLLALQPVRVALASQEHVRHALEVELDLLSRDEEVLTELIDDAGDLLSGRHLGSRAEALDGDVVEEAPGCGSGDSRGHEPARDDHHHPRAVAHEAGRDIDDDVLATSRGERCSHETD